MKFVDRHGTKVAKRGKTSSRSSLLERLDLPSAAVQTRSCAPDELPPQRGQQGWFAGSVGPGIAVSSSRFKPAR